MFQHRIENRQQRAGGIGVMRIDLFVANREK
jgi:hypothetical protein